MFKKSTFLGLLACGCLTGSAVAAPSTTWEIDTNNTVSGVMAMSLIADGEGVDWTAAVLVIELTQGSVYNGSPNSDRPQDGFWGIPGFDILEWDTWVGVPGGVNDVGPLGAGDLGSPALSLSGNLISVAWGGTATTETGPTRIANISLTDDAVGTWQLLTSFAGNVIVESSGVIPIPEPGTLALCAGGAVLALSRRRKG